MDEWGLTDIWRVRHPHERAFTFRRGSYSSRLDLFLVSPQLADLSRDTKISFLPCSDHSLISIQINFDFNTERGPGFWRFNTELLANTQFVSEMNDFLQDWNPLEELSSPMSTWEWLKHEIRNFTRQFSRENKSEEIQMLQDLERELVELVERRDGGEKELNIPIDSATRQIREIEETRARRSIFASRANWALYGEKPSSSS